MKQTNRKADLPLLLLAVVLIFLIVCPVGMIFAKAVMQNGRLDFSPAVQTLLNPENAHMIGNSLLLGVLVVLLSTLIAAPLAYLFSRTKFARYRVFDILFMIPFMTPPYIASMGWILFMQKKGLLQQLIPAAAGCEKIFFTLGGLVLVMSLHVFPFMLTMLKNAMLNIPSSLEEAGAVFGAGFGARMRKIFLPLLSGNYAIGALLVFVKTLSEYGTPSTLGKRIGFEVFTTEIHRHATVAPIDFGSSATLSSVLVGICLCIMVLAYVELFLPYTVQYVTSSFTQISDSLMAAGQVFGGSPAYILRRITLPLIRQGIATGWMMTFIIAFRELVTASLIAPPNTLVVSTFIVREFEQGSVSVGMAMAVLCVLFSTTALLILNTVINRRKEH